MFCRPGDPSCRHTRPESLHQPKVQLRAPCVKCLPIFSIKHAPQGKNPMLALCVRCSCLAAVTLRCLGEGRRGSLCGLKICVEGAESEPEPNT